MDACKTLGDYAHILALVRCNSDVLHMQARTAVDSAITQCINEDCLSDYLARHRAEVGELLFSMEDEERARRIHDESIAQDAIERGRAEGIDIGRAEGIEEVVERLRAAGFGEDVIRVAQGKSPEGE